MQDDLQALLDCLHEAERRAEDEETQPVLLLLLDLLLQLRPSLEDLAAVPVGVLVSRLGRKSSRVSEAVRESAVRCKRAWQALLQEQPSPAACTAAAAAAAAATAAAASASTEESGGHRAAQTARLSRCFRALCTPPEWAARELEQVIYARVAAGAGDRQCKKQRCEQPKGQYEDYSPLSSPPAICINAPEGCQHGTHTNETAYPPGTYAGVHTNTQLSPSNSLDRIPNCSTLFGFCASSR